MIPIYEHISYFIYLSDVPGVLTSIKGISLENKNENSHLEQGLPINTYLSTQSTQLTSCHYSLKSY